MGFGHFTPGGHFGVGRGRGVGFGVGCVLKLPTFPGATGIAYRVLAKTLVPWKPLPNERLNALLGTFFHSVDDQ
jgi:hypothetical protein